MSIKHEKPTKYIDHILNNSYSKNAFKFSKSDRFPSSNRVQTEYSYMINNVNNNKKGCSMGFGNRTNFITQQKIPASNFYQIKPQISNKTVKMGLGRSDIKFRSFLNDCFRKGSICGQNCYELGTTIRSKKISLHKRLPTDIDIKSRNDTPGPSAYQLKSHCINGTGRYVNSRFRNSRMTSLLGTQNDNFQKLNHKEIGPGSYNIEKSIGSSLFYSKYQGFGTSQRINFVERQSKLKPGPGHYRIFSEFSNMTNDDINQ